MRGSTNGALVFLLYALGWTLLVFYVPMGDLIRWFGIGPMGPTLLVTLIPAEIFGIAAAVHWTKTTAMSAKVQRTSFILGILGGTVHGIWILLTAYLSVPGFFEKLEPGQVYLIFIYATVNWFAIYISSRIIYKNFPNTVRAVASKIMLP